MIKMVEKKWTSPACPLLCQENIQFTKNSDFVSPKTFACSKASFFLGEVDEYKDIEFNPIINGSQVGIDTALYEISKWVSLSRNPLISGLGVDVSGARSIVKFASKTNAILDHKQGDVLTKITKSIQNKGSFFTTLSEIKSRADLIVLIGNDDKKKRSCFFKTINQGSKSKKRKETIFYGDSFDSRNELLQSLQNLSALLKNRNFSSATMFNKDFLNKLSNYSYIAFVWDPNEYHDVADSLADILLEIIRELNKVKRGGILTLAGDEGSITMQSVMTWMTGLPLRTAFRKKGLLYRPEQFSTRRLIEEDSIDLIIWISCFNSDIPDFFEHRSCPMIVLGHTQFQKKLLNSNFNNFIYFPVATPGIDLDGHMIRCDGVVTTPIKKIIESKQKSLQYIIDKILDMA